MLMLWRKRNQRLLINDEIEITIADIQRDKVWVGITAPRHVTIARCEMMAEPTPGFLHEQTVASSLVATLRRGFDEAIAKGVPADTLSAAVRQAIERGIADAVASAAGETTGLPPATA